MWVWFRPQCVKPQIQSSNGPRQTQWASVCPTLYRVCQRWMSDSIDPAETEYSSNKSCSCGLQWCWFSGPRWLVGHLRLLPDFPWGHLWPANLSEFIVLLRASETEMEDEFLLHLTATYKQWPALRWKLLSTWTSQHSEVSSNQPGLNPGSVCAAADRTELCSVCLSGSISQRSCLLTNEASLRTLIIFTKCEKEARELRPSDTKLRLPHVEQREKVSSGFVKQENNQMINWWLLIKIIVDSCISLVHTCGRL